MNFDSPRHVISGPMVGRTGRWSRCDWPNYPVRPASLPVCRTTARYPSIGFHRERIRVRWRSTGRCAAAPRRIAWTTPWTIVSSTRGTVPREEIARRPIRWGSTRPSSVSRITRSWSRAAWRIVCWWTGARTRRTRRRRRRSVGVATTRTRARADFRETPSPRAGRRYRARARSASSVSRCVPTATRPTSRAPTPRPTSASTRTSR